MALNAFGKLSLRFTRKIGHRSNYLAAMSPLRRRYMHNLNNEEIYPIQHLRSKLAELMGVKAEFSPLIHADREMLMQYLPKSQSELPPRSMKDSFLVGLIPLSSDLELQDKYVSFLGQVRLGRLLEDMDIFAVMVAQKHNYNPNLPEGVPSPQTLVTAMVDRIDFTGYTPTAKEDIKISGHVSWVGKTSMETVVWLEQLHQGTWMKITKALFLIAARDPINAGPAVVNQLVPDGEREKAIFAGGESRKRNRFELKGRDVTKVIPTPPEQKAIHDLFLRTLDLKGSLQNVSLPPGGAWMSDLVLLNTLISQPENRNLHNTVFGGFLMRQALELAFVLAYKFTKYRPKVEHISNIAFIKPIAVNSLIHMYAHVVYTKLNYVQIVVYTEDYNPKTGRNETTTTFHITYQVPELVTEVVPRTYHEAMMYIDGMRHFNEAVNGKGALEDVEIIQDGPGKSKL